MEMRRLRAWWWQKQGFGRGPGVEQSPAEVLLECGWARSVGGANPYITLFSRGIETRDRMDMALEQQEIHELPCARGCTYVVPRDHYATALKVGQGFSDTASMNTARKVLGVTDSEIDSLMTSVEEALRADGAMDPAELRRALGDKVRNLGEEGKKRGQTTTLPLALGFLQSSGRIRRIPIDGRLDQQRYRYAIWSPSPLAGDSRTHAEAYVDLAKAYFEWTGPAKPENFRWFSGLGAGVAGQTLSECQLEDVGEGYLISSAERAEFEQFEMPEKTAYALVSSIDAHLLLRRDLPNLIEPADESQQMSGEKGLMALKGVPDLANHAIVDRGRVVGLWEFDPFEGEIVWHAFGGADDLLRSEVERTERFIRNSLGDCRSFSLDSPESRRPKLQQLRDLSLLKV